MSRFSRFGVGTPTKAVKTSGTGVEYVDYKDVETLRRMMSPNGKIYGRSRTSMSAAHQRKVSKAVKRARYMGLLPYTSATLSDAAASASLFRRGM